MVEIEGREMIIYINHDVIMSFSIETNSAEEWGLS